MPDIEDSKLAELKSRLNDNTQIPPEDSLILVARSLLERGEYRSAVIESSAALKISIEKKIVENLTEQGKSQTEIEAFLLDTQTKFYKRCDIQLRQCTGNPFVHDNSVL